MLSAFWEDHRGVLADVFFNVDSIRFHVLLGQHHWELVVVWRLICRVVLRCDLQTVTVLV